MSGSLIYQPTALQVTQLVLTGALLCSVDEDDYVRRHTYQVRTSQRCKPLESIPPAGLPWVDLYLDQEGSSYL